MKVENRVKICHVTCVHPRYDVRILKKECVSLSNNGYDVYLVVNDDKKDEVYKGVKIVSTGFVPCNRRDRLMKASSYVLDKALRINADIYHLHDPELLKISKILLKKGKKVIFDAHEDTEEQIKDKQWIPKYLRGIVAYLYGKYSLKKMKSLNGIISVTPNIVEKYKKRNANTIMVTNYPILDEEFAVDIISEENYIFFAGGISEQWCHERIAQAVLKLDDVSYMFAGKSDCKEYIEKICINERIKYLEVIPHEKVTEYYKKSIAGMAILECTQVGNEGTLGNTKLFEVMQAGKPVICSDLRLWRDIINEYKCGICVDSSDVNAIANAIKYLMLNHNKALEMGRNGRKAVEEKFNWRTQEKMLVDFYNRLN